MTTIKQIKIKTTVTGTYRENFFGTPTELKEYIENLEEINPSVNFNFDKAKLYIYRNNETCPTLKMEKESTTNLTKKQKNH